MMISKKILVVLIAFFTLGSAMAQEMLTGFQREVRLQDMSLKSVVQAKTLPFFDDFSISKVYPNQQNWLDDAVFINTDFSLYPTNTKVATFDVLDPTGRVYSHASTVPFAADYLHSAPIRLDSIFEIEKRALSLADSLYLSFTYQPQGRGDAPERSDSLVLQFAYRTGNKVFDRVDSINILVDLYLEANQIDSIFPLDVLYAPQGCNEELFWVSNRILTWGDYVTIPCDSVFKPEVAWRNVWAAKGQTLDEFLAEKGDYFEQVMIPITNADYFFDEFQFRFFNYGSIAGSIALNNKSNVDHWNLDFIYLNYNRSIADTTYPMITFSESAPSFLKRYRQMPYRQFLGNPTSAVNPSFEMYITNLDAISHQTNYSYFVQQVGRDFAYSYNGGTCELFPYSQMGFQNCELGGCHQRHACPYVNSNFSFDFELDSTSYSIKHYISDSTVNPILVDSLIFRQGFYNYFSYDDGTPEFGYGVEPVGAAFAVQFEMSTPDTLRGVQMLFNQTLNNANYDYFDIVVWRDNNGRPGEEMYRLSNQRPQWSDMIYDFMYYKFDRVVVVNGLFYVGIVQSELGSINIGFDASKDNSSYNFYNAGENWLQSQFAGSIMLRPVVGAPYIVSVNEIEEPKSVKIYPNPAQNTLNIVLPENVDQSQVTISIYDITGRLVLRRDFEPQISVVNLDEGFYQLQLQTRRGNTFTEKMIISH
ncbi:MAG: T9SS type A sorting domain-containing protein [Lentimicrobiaceae bacterium]|jgi:hypothetical protein|nr:T9SS type A sorting domain-containing protein [Lentimicrobiaceae bacterium]